MQEEDEPEKKEPSPDPSVLEEIQAASARVSELQQRIRECSRECRRRIEAELKKPGDPETFAARIHEECKHIRDSARDAIRRLFPPEETAACVELAKKMPPEELKRIRKEAVDQIMAARERMPREPRDLLIHHAARAGDIEELQRLIAARAPVNAPGFGENTPLMYAARSERADPEVLRMLIDAGADVNAHGEPGTTALREAVAADSFEKVKVLVEAGCDVRAADERGSILAVWRGNRALFEYLLERGADCNRDTQSRWGCLATELYCAGRFDDLEYVHARGASLDPLQLPPLIAALLFGTGGEFEAALSRGADPEATDFRGATALLMALRARNLSAAERLRAAGADIGAIHRRRKTGMETSNALRAAIETDDPAVVAWVLAHGVAVDARDRCYESPLFFAVSEDRVNSARALLEAGADIHKENEFGREPINKATSLRMLEVLIEHGADVNHVDRCGEWPLKEFSFHGNAPAVRKLLAAGAEVNRTSTGKIALHSAVRADDAETVRILVDAGADINARDCDGWSVLFSVKSRRVLALLVAAGIDFTRTIEDMCGFPAWHWIEDPELAAEVKRLASEAKARRSGGAESGTTAD